MRPTIQPSTTTRERQSTTTTTTDFFERARALTVARRVISSVSSQFASPRVGRSGTTRGLTGFTPSLP